MKTLNTISQADLASAKEPEYTNAVLPAGVHRAKLLSVTEEDTYRYLTFEIDKKKYNFFFNYYLKDSNDLNKTVLSWLYGLATIPVVATTTLLEVINSAYGNTYNITTYTYKAKSGKNAGTEQHGISFKDLPILQETTIEQEELTLPF